MFVSEGEPIKVEYHRHGGVSCVEVYLVMPTACLDTGIRARCHLNTAVDVSIMPNSLYIMLPRVY